MEPGMLLGITRTSAGTAEMLTERELIAQYVTSGSDEILEQIVSRYSKMVYSVCLRMLNEKQAADDATQATFIAFTERGRSLKPDTQLSGWFYLTARNCARNIRREMTRRHRHEREAIQMTVEPKNPPDSGPWGEIRPALDSAIAILPAEQRQAIILRYFSGLSEADAAREAGCPESTIHMRVARGVEKLRDYFQRRGTILTGVTLGALLADRSVEQISGRLQQIVMGACKGNVPVAAHVVSAAKAASSGAAAVKAAVILAVIAAVAIPVSYQFSKRPPIVASVSPTVPVAAGATVPRYYVDAGNPAARDDNDGSSVKPFMTIQRAADLAQPGDLIRIYPGTYSEDVLVSSGGAPGRPVVFEAAEPRSTTVVAEKCVFRPDGSKPENQRAQYVILRGLVMNIKNHVGSAVLATTGWKIENCLIERCGEGIVAMGYNIAIADSDIRNIESNGINLQYGRGHTISNCRFQNCNSKGLELSLGVAACVATHTDELSIENSTFTDNACPGVWLNWVNTNARIENCKFARNMNGVQWQSNTRNGLIRNCTFFDHRDRPALCVFEAQDLKIESNTFAANKVSIDLREQMSASPGNHGYIWSNGELGSGFSFTVPADTNARSVSVYGGASTATATLTAHLSDASATDYVQSFTGPGAFLCTITYKAASAGQSLRLTLVKSGNNPGFTDGSADLMAAWLTPADKANSALSGTLAPAADSYNLTALGTLDWAQWGAEGEYSNFDHKSSGNDRISNFQKVGTGGHYGLFALPTRTTIWSDGAPNRNSAFDQLDRITISGNAFHSWNQCCMNFTDGDWKRKDPAARELTLDGNTYGPGNTAPAMIWFDKQLQTVDEMRSILHFEKTGKTKIVPFDPGALESRSEPKF
jgi:RNA polymerase sigma factor (sigma-70 family)